MWKILIIGHNQLLNNGEVNGLEIKLKFLVLLVVMLTLSIRMKQESLRKMDGFREKKKNVEGSWTENWLG